jgi:hypothetical protein
MSEQLASVRKILIDWNEGRFSWQDATAEVVYAGCRIIEVPESVARMWEVAAQIDAEVQVQLRALDQTRSEESNE